MDVDLSNKRELWLVKVPKYMANAWAENPGSSNLGKLQFPKDGKGRPKFVPNPQHKLPKEYQLQLNPLVGQRMVVLSPDGEKVSFEGEVKQRGELRPMDKSYMDIKVNAIKESAKPERTTQILDKVVTSYKPRGAAQLAHEADLRKKKEEAKKTIREDKEIVQKRIFYAFEKQQYYNIRDLAKITNQPIPYLKEILKELCLYCSKSANKNMWELKPEYRHYKKPAAAPSTSSGNT